MANVFLNRVRKVYPSGVVALREMNLHVADGELVVLVGPSGSGKTTTLRLIAGLEQVTSGSIAIGGRPATDCAPRDRDVALVSQRHLLLPHLTVRENLEFGYRLRSAGWRPFRSILNPQAKETERELGQRVADVAELLDLQDVLERRPAELSGGQQQRTALGRALVRRAEILLLDEPLAHLDLPLRNGLRRQLHLLHRRLPATILYVTHDPVDAMILADRVVVLRDGIVQQVDCPLTVHAEPANRFVAGFFGWPAMNLIDGDLMAGHLGLEFLTPAGRLHVPGNVVRRWGLRPNRSVTMGIRPEHLNLALLETSPLTLPSSLVMEVLLVETVGNLTLVALKRNGIQLTGQANANPAASDRTCITLQAGRVVKEGDPMLVGIDMDQAHWFDGTTGERLPRRPDT